MAGAAGDVTVLAPIEAVDRTALGAGRAARRDSTRTCAASSNPAWRFADAVRLDVRGPTRSPVDVIKAFAHSDASTTADELLAIAQRVDRSRRSVELTQAGLGYIEICPRGRHEGERSRGRRRPPRRRRRSDILVFGDMPNDLPMFAYAGWGRVAVANAHPLCSGDRRRDTAGNDDDGVATYLEDLMDGEPARLRVSRTTSRRLRVNR